MEDAFTVKKAGSGGAPFWVWILVALGVAGAGELGFLFWNRRKARST